MRFAPFKLKDYPYIETDLASIHVDSNVARLGKNAIRKNDRIIFFANYADGMRQVEVPLDEEGYQKASLTEPEKMCLSRILDLLEKADALDAEALGKSYISQFEITKTFRGFDQNFGGERFVNLARDLIDKHMGKCLFPYMLHDLILGVYLAYNKNVNRDIDGLMSSIVSFIDESKLIPTDSDSLFEDIEEKSTPRLFIDFLEHAMPSSIWPSVSDFAVTLFTDPYHFRANHAKEIPASLLAAFPKPSLLQFFQWVSPLYSEKVAEVFALLGETCDPDYLEAYQKNRDCDAGVVLNTPAFSTLDPHKLEELQWKEWLLSQRRGYDVVSRFDQLKDTDEQLRFIKTCKEAGWDDIGKILAGEEFFLRRVDTETFFALLPHMNLEIDDNRRQAVSYVREMLRYRLAGTEDYLLRLEHPAFAEIVRSALQSEQVDSMRVRLILADRFHCPEAIGLKEWR